MYVSSPVLETLGPVFGVPVPMPEVPKLASGHTVRVLADDADPSRFIIDW